MDLRTDLLTWQGLRALAQVETVTCGDQLAYVRMDPTRPPCKGDYTAWIQTAVPQRPEAGDLVYVRMGWRHPWRQQYLAEVTVPTVLVGSFYDPSIKASAVAELLGPSSAVRHWFGMQVDTTHPRLTALPLGVEPAMVPVLQAAERGETRDHELYLNFQTVRTFHWAAPDGTSRPVPDPRRTMLWRHFAGRPWVTADPFNEADPGHYARQLGRSRFVLSPPRWAWDCYRTYEAIAMGAIPIVQRHPPTTDHLEALPVLLVDHWREVTRDRLAREWDIRQPKATETMTQTYWTRQIEATVARVREECMSYGDH